MKNQPKPLFEVTELFEDFLTYYEKAYMLQLNQFEDGQFTEKDIDDPLMWHVPIYNNVQRRYAGFSNALEALWYGSHAPKKPYPHMDKCSDRWQLEDWMYVMMFHRITGSGASFESDHGWRNSIIELLCECEDMNEMVELVLEAESQGLKMFTSIGNQPPMFTKFSHQMRPGCYYLTKIMPTMIKVLADLLRERKSAVEQYEHSLPEIFEIVDWLNKYNQDNKMKRFTFCYTAFAMDLGEYFPEYVDKWSRVYAGSNATKCLELVLPRVSGKPFDWLNEALQFCIEETSMLVGKKVSTRACMEDVHCDHYRHLHEYYAPQYESLPLDKLKNNCPSKQRIGQERFYEFLRSKGGKYHVQ